MKWPRKFQHDGHVCNMGWRGISGGGVRVGEWMGEEGNGGHSRPGTWGTVDYFFIQSM